MTVRSDLTIGPGSGYQNSYLEVQNDAQVRILPGGSIQGFNAVGTSKIIIDGGEISFVGSLGESSTLVMNSGSFACTHRDCLFVDLAYLLAAADDAHIELHGGTHTWFPYLRLGDASTLDVYGVGLTLDESLQGWDIRGELETGDSASTLVQGAEDVYQRIRLINTGLPGDYSGDGVVDAADYTTWRDRLGTQFTEADYDLWLSQYGPAGAAGFGVPEPATLTAMIVALAAAQLGRDRGRKVSS